MIIQLVAKTSPLNPKVALDLLDWYEHWNYLHLGV